MRRFLPLTVFIFCLVLMVQHHAWAQTDNSETVLKTPASLEADHKSQSIFDRLKQTNGTLYEALAAAYQNNPTLQAARIEVLAVEEELSQAISGFRPTISASADITHTDTKTKGTSFITSDGGNTSKSAELSVNQPLFKGGSTVAKIGQAKNNINAEQLALSATEQSILYDAAVAYMDVLKNKAVLDLDENNSRLVARELEQTQNRFIVGELTRTDVSQSEARLAKAKAGAIKSNGALKNSIVLYRKIVGMPPPIDIAYPNKSIPLPDTQEEIVALAESNNRNVLKAKYIKAAAKDNVSSIFGELLPQISALGSLNKTYDPNDGLDEQRQATIGVSASIPLYTGGATLSRVREAKKRANKRQIEIIEARNTARQEALQNWESLKSAREETKARQTQIKASRIAQEGVHYESELGERTTLDVLNANQELLDAQVSFITAKRDEIVAEFALARSLGVLVPQNFGFSTINP